MICSDYLPIKAILRNIDYDEDGTADTVVSIDAFDSIESFRAFERASWRNPTQDILLVFDTRNGAIVDGDLVRIARATGWR